MNKDSVFLIPIYNEKPLIVISILEEILNNTDSDIYIYNDGSKNDIDLILDIYNRNERITVFNAKKNKGQGYALKTLSKLSIKNNYKYYITFDSDGQHRVVDVNKLLNYIKIKNLDIVLGKRDINNPNIPYIRRILLKFGKLILNYVFNIKFQDPQNGLRIFNKVYAKEILSNININRFGHATEILDRINSNKDIKYEELDIKVIYNKYTISKGQKNINIFNIFLEYIKYKIYNNKGIISIYNYLHKI